MQDDNLPKRRWNVHSRTAYNYSWRGMTPVWNIGNRLLWLGGQPAANTVQNLQHCGIKFRMSALGSWGCKKSDDITDLRTYRMNNCQMDTRGLPVSNDFDPVELRSALHRMDLALQDGSLLVFCKQGCMTWGATRSQRPWATRFHRPGPYRLGPGDTALSQ